MKRNLTLLCAAAAAVGCQAINILSSPAAAGSRGSVEAFSHVSEGSLFGACFESVQLAKAPGVSFSKACADAFVKGGAQATLVASDCAELAGRVSEANDEQFLGDGRLLCGRLIHERALVAGRPLAAFAPSEGLQGSAAAGAFCDVMRAEALPFCAPPSAGPAAATLVAADAAVLPAAAVAPPRVQATPALRAAEIKPVRQIAVAPQQPPQLLVASPQSVVQPAPRLIPEPVVTPQMSEAAQTIAAGMFPAFAHQVPQALAAGLPSASPMNVKAEQQPDLNNAGIWSNLAALLHRTG